MPKILRVLNRLVIGGPAFNACYLTKYMPTQYETRLVVGAKEGHEQDSPLPGRLGLTVHTIEEMKRAINPMQDYKAFKKMKALIQAYKPDIVHTHAAKSGAIGRLAAAACKVPIIVHTFHGHVFHSYFGKAKTNFYINAERYLAKKTNAIITISDIQFREIVHDFKIGAPEKFSVIPLGLDLAAFGEDVLTKRNVFRNEMQLDSHVMAIGIVGRLVPVKNHLLFIDIAAKLKAATTIPLKFIVVGDGESRQQIEAYATQQGLQFCTSSALQKSADIIFTSWRTDLDNVYAGLDMVLLTSKNEGTPVSLIEAQSAYKPVLSTNVGGVANVVLHEQSGFVLPDNAHAFLEPMLQLIHNKSMRQQFGQAGYDYVHKHFGYERLVKDMDALYTKLLHK
jgi:glycosyltransferase involved in cell wall biosynthesis